MSLPKYNELYTLLLTALQDGNAHTMKEVRDFIAQALHLTEQELAETLPSGTQSVFTSRSNWAKTYLKKAQMIDSPQRGYVILTPAGKSLLESGVPITNSVLAQKCPDFLEFYQHKNLSNSITPPMNHKKKHPKRHRKPLSGSIP